MTKKTKKGIPEPKTQLLEKIPSPAQVRETGGSILSKYDSEIYLLQSLRDTLELIQYTRTGILKKTVLLIAEKIGLTLKEIADILHISERTLHRYPDQKRLDVPGTEKAIFLAKLALKGENVFEDANKFKSWMNHPSPALGLKKPIELLDTHFGQQMVFDELVRIEHGVLA